MFFTIAGMTWDEPGRGLVTKASPRSAFVRARPFTVLLRLIRSDERRDKGLLTGRRHPAATSPTLRPCDSRISRSARMPQVWEVSLAAAPPIQTVPQRSAV